MFSHSLLAILCTVLHTTAGQCKWSVPDVHKENDVHKFMHLHTADFLTVPSDACASPGDVVDFCCTTVFTIGDTVLPGQQEWVVTPLSGLSIQFSSDIADPAPPTGFSFIRDPDLSGIGATATSILNNATFQCIALQPNTGDRNYSALAIATLQVAGTATLLHSTTFPYFLLKKKKNAMPPPLRRAMPVQLWASLLPSSLLTWSGHHVHSAVECTVDCRLCSTHQLHHHSDKER